MGGGSRAGVALNTSRFKKRPVWLLFPEYIGDFAFLEFPRMPSGDPGNPPIFIGSAKDGRTQR